MKHFDLSLFVLMAFGMIGTTPTALAGTTGPADICQTQGPVTVCNQNGFGQYYSVKYSGYLLKGRVNFQQCRPDYVSVTDIDAGIIINGGPVQRKPLLANCQEGENRLPFSTGFSGAGNMGTKIEIYFSNGSGDYDSQYGNNYTFQF